MRKQIKVWQRVAEVVGDGQVPPPDADQPTDAGAGEGFTNTGQSLVMSPALVAKYLDAAKAVADHAVPVPDGFRFSAADSRAGWTQARFLRLEALSAPGATVALVNFNVQFCPEPKTWCHVWSD